MKLFFDTSVLVATLVAGHPHHGDCWPWFEAVRSERHQGLTASHCLAELYATLTAMPLRPALAPSEVRLLIQASVLPFFSVVSLELPDYLAAVDLVTARLLRSGAIFDALIEVGARKAAADRLITVNAAHFNRLSDEPRWVLDPRGLTP